MPEKTSAEIAIKGGQGVESGDLYRKRLIVAFGAVALKWKSAKENRVFLSLSRKQITLSRLGDVSKRSFLLWIPSFRRVVSPRTCSLMEVDASPPGYLGILPTIDELIMNRLLCAIAPMLVVCAIGCGPNKGTTELPKSDEVITTLTTEAPESTGSAAAGGASALSQ